MTVGNHDNTEIDEFEQQPGIEEIILHESYSSKCKDSDVPICIHFAWDIRLDLDFFLRNYS